MLIIVFEKCELINMIYFREKNDSFDHGSRIWIQYVLVGQLSVQKVKGHG